jgi:hypothetical protein
MTRILASFVLLAASATAAAADAEAQAPAETQAPAKAETQAQAPRRWLDSVSAYAGQGVDLNLREFPRAAFEGDLRGESTYFAGIGLAHSFGTLGRSFEVVRGSALENVQHGYELLLLKHHGLQENAEIGVAYMLRTPDAALGQLHVNAGFGVGISHALGSPTYEDGPRDDPERRYRTQLLLLIEGEWRWGAESHWSLVTRIHHRSGAYGTIAPRFVGSNFVVAGVRYRF